MKRRISLFGNLVLLIFITSIFLSCEILWRKVIDNTITFDYLEDNFANDEIKIYPRTCYKMDLKAFKSGYKDNVPKAKRNKNLEKVKHQRNKLFTADLDSFKSRGRYLASNIMVVIVDSKGDLIKHQLFIYSEKQYIHDYDGLPEPFDRYHYLIVLDEQLSRKNMDKDRWPIFLTVSFPDGKFIKYKFH